MWYSYKGKRRIDEDERTASDEPSVGIPLELDVNDTPEEYLYVPYSDEERKAALAAELGGISIGAIDPDEYCEHSFLVSSDDDGGEYLVLTDEEANEKWRESVENTLLDCGLEGLDIDICDFVDEEYCEETVEEYYACGASDMDSEDLAKELLDADEIKLSDESIFRLRSREDLGLDDGEEIDADDPDNYEIVCSHGTLVGKYIDCKRNIGDFAQEYWDLGFGDGIEEELTYYFRRHHQFPSWFDFDALVDYCMDDRGAALATFDFEERSQDFNGRLYYIYRTE